MPSATSIYQPQGWSQRNQRQDQMFTDDHGREWFGSIETKTGHVCGLLEPQFSAPLMPDQKYLERIPKRPYDIHINYDRWLADIRGTRAEWEREGRQMMRKMRGAGYDPTEEFGADVLDIIGEPPEAVEPVIAARQGNSWVLGLTRKVDRRLLKYFDLDKLGDKVRREHEPDFRDQDVIEAEKREMKASKNQRLDSIGKVQKGEEDFRDDGAATVEGSGLEGIPSRKDDWDEEYTQRTGRPDPDDEVDPRVERAEQHEVRGRQPMRSNRPLPRSVTKGEGRRKGHRPNGEEKGKAAKRERYPKGHPKAGAFVPAIEVA